MKIFKGIKVNKKTIISLIILITLVEMYFAYRVVYDYKGIYPVSMFIPFIFQAFMYWKLINKEINYKKIRIFIMVLISISLPLVIYFTLPNYSYHEGKETVENYLEENTNIEFVDFSIGKDTIPVMNNPKKIFISDREYYYKVILSDEVRYFMVNPITGRLNELPEGYWE